MVFSSLTFLYIFLPVCLIFYFACPKLTYKNIVLVVFSLLFYAWGEPVYVFLMIASSGFNYISGVFIDRQEKESVKRIALIVSVIVNIGALVFFKYTGFILENIGLESIAPEITLPIGISFYTFQSLSYVVDVYRKSVPAQRSFYKLLLYISLFPQLIAGPIVRYEDVEKEISSRSVDFTDISSGINRFCIGLAKKVLLANNCGMVVRQIFEYKTLDTTILGTWFGMILFAFQIYFDFSGYSDMAIGLGRIFGFHYKENFDYPYVSKSATEFWRRWHMSLGSFFRDYVYIPLGGNRRHMWVNLFVVWFLTGLWHGASWNFVLWGLMYGILISVEKLLSKRFEKRPVWVTPFSYIYMFVVTIFGWTLFYFTDFESLKTALSAMVGAERFSFTNFFINNLVLENAVLFLVALFFCFPFDKKIWSLLKEKFPAVSGVLAIVLNIAAVAFSTIMLVGETYNPFLYFRF